MYYNNVCLSVSENLKRTVFVHRKNYVAIQEATETFQFVERMAEQRVDEWRAKYYDEVGKNIALKSKLAEEKQKNLVCFVMEKMPHK